MATLLDAIRSGALERYDLPEWETRTARRPLYVARELIDWVDDTEELHTSIIGGRTLGEHLEQMFCDFRCDERVHYADLKRMLPTKAGIWHMYPPGLRVYGWCPEIHSFVAVAAAVETATKLDLHLNDRKRDTFLHFAQRQGLADTIRKGDNLVLFPHQGKR
jgi:hypothetical protein